MHTVNCPGCNAPLHIDPDQKFIVCEYCGATNNVQNLMDIPVDEIKQKDLDDAHFVLAEGEYDDAYTLFDKFIMNYPDDYHGYYGKACAITYYFSDFENVHNDGMDEFTDCMRSALQLSPKQNRNSIKRKYDQYVADYKQYCKQLEQQKKQAKLQEESVTSDTQSKQVKTLTEEEALNILNASEESKKRIEQEKKKKHKSKIAFSIGCNIFLIALTVLLGIILGGASIIYIIVFFSTLILNMVITFSISYNLRSHLCNHLALISTIIATALFFLFNLPFAVEFTLLWVLVFVPIYILIIIIACKVHSNISEYH